jgi:multicomponent Na+:H+ antiporter subunit G
VTVAAWVPWLSDALVLLGLTVMTFGVVGIVSMPDIFTKQHAASKSVFLGVCSILVAVAISGNLAFTARAVLIGALLILTTPVAAHEIAKAAAKEGEVNSPEDER